MNISLLGLFVDERKQVKAFFEEWFSDRELNWVSATDGKIDVLVVRAAFLETETLIKFLDRLKMSQVCVLSVAKSDKEKQLSDTLRIPCVILPIIRESEATNWLSNIATTELMTKNKTIQSNRDQENNRYFIDFINDFMVDVVQAKSTRKMECGGILYWFDGQLSRVYYSSDQGFFAKTAPWVDLGEFQATELLENLPSTELTKWLWDNIWKAEGDFISIVNVDGRAYRLTKWPYFCRVVTFGRMEVIKLTAILQQKILTFQQLIQYSKVPQEIVAKYLYVTTLLGCAIKVAPRPVQQGIKTPVSSPESMPKYKGFLARLKTFIGM